MLPANLPNMEVVRPGLRILAEKDEIPLSGRLGRVDKVPSRPGLVSDLPCVRSASLDGPEAQPFTLPAMACLSSRIFRCCFGMFVLFVKGSIQRRHAVFFHWWLSSWASLQKPPNKEAPSPPDA